METGAVVKHRKGLTCVERGRGICYQLKEKGQCLQGDRCCFRHDTQDRAQKPEHTAATPSEPALSRGRSVSKKRSIRGKSNHGSILRQPCRYYFEVYMQCDIYRVLHRIGTFSLGCVATKVPIATHPPFFVKVRCVT